MAHPETTVDGDHGPGDVRRLVAREEGEDGGDLLGRRGATQRDRRADGGLAVVREVCGHVGVDEAGRHDIARDAASSQLARKRTGEADESRLACGIAGLSGAAGQPDYR